VCRCDKRTTVTVTAQVKFTGIESTCYKNERMRGSVIEGSYQSEVSTIDGLGRNQDDGTISRISLKFTLSG
jgi:hypothetical protein